MAFTPGKLQQVLSQVKAGEAAGPNDIAPDLLKHMSIKGWWCRPHPVREHAQDLRPPLGARPASPPTRQAAQQPPRGPSTNPRPLV